MSYGIGYVGSKNKIAKRLIEKMPEADYFVDLFAGGGSMTHAAIESGKYKHFIFNDINKDCVTLFKNAVRGEYLKRYGWVSRRAFHALKSTDLLIRTVYSFSQNGIDYIYGESKEMFQRALHYAVIFSVYGYLEEFDEMLADRLKYEFEGKSIKERLTIIHKSGLRIKNFEALQRLNNLTILNKADIRYSHLPYFQVQIPANSVIYCDPPYKDTSFDYSVKFDHAAFVCWAKNQNNIFVSEYDMPTPFRGIFHKTMVGTFCNNTENISIEKLYTL